MNSINTNIAAMTALQSLNQTNKALLETQSRISTGLAVATAADNAAYFSIATTMKSDNAALSTVQDALGLGAATVDVAYTALDSTIKVVDEIKTKLVDQHRRSIVHDIDTCEDKHHEQSYLAERLVSKQIEVCQCLH